MEFFYVEATEPQPDVLVDMVLSWILAVGQRGTDGQVTPLRLELTRAVCSIANCLKAISAAACVSRPTATRLVFRGSDLDRPFVTHNDELLAVIGTQLDSELEARNTSMNVGEQVKDALSGDHWPASAPRCKMSPRNSA